MGWLMRIFDRLAEEEDEQVMGVMHKLYGPLMQLTLLFPSWKRSQIKVTLACIALFLFGIPLHFLVLVFSTINLRDRFDLASMAFHYGMIFTFLQVAIVIMNVERNLIASIHRRIATDMGNYRSGRIYVEDKPQTWENAKTAELKKFLLLPGGVLVLAALLLLVPYIKKLAQEESGEEGHYTKYGVNLNLPIATYYPFPTHTGILHGVTVLGQVTAGGVLAVELAAFEIMLFRVSQAIIFEYKVLQFALETLFKRAKQLHRKTYPEKATKELHTSDPELQACIGMCLNDCIAHHYNISEAVGIYETAIKWPAALAYSIGTGIIGLSLINMLEANESGDRESLVLFAGLTSAEVINMYILSSFGEDITTESKSLRDVLYDMDWYKLDIKNRRTMLNFLTGITNPVIVKAGGLVALSMDTFSSIINSAYSFFNLVNAQ